MVIDSPFHVKAAWVLPLAEGSETKLLLIDGNNAVAEDCQCLFEENAKALHRINLICSQSSEESKEEPQKIQTNRMKEKYELFKTITSWMNYCKLITVLKIKRFPLSKVMVEDLAQGLRNSKSIQHLSLEECSLGDEGCFILCSTLTCCPTISTISFQGNNLTKDSAAAIAALLERQEIVRGLAWWKRSLRNRHVEMETLLGLNRITLNNNTAITDEGLHLIVESLYDDFWIKAIDMQACGISNKGALEVVKLLKVNKGIHVFDLRNNEGVSMYSLRSIMHRISENLGPNRSEAIWLGSETSTEIPSSKKVSSCKVSDAKNEGQLTQAPLPFSRSNRRGLHSSSIELKRSFSTKISSKKRLNTAAC